MGGHRHSCIPILVRALQVDAALMEFRGQPEVADDLRGVLLLSLAFMEP